MEADLSDLDYLDDLGALDGPDGRPARPGLPTAKPALPSRPVPVPPAAPALPVSTAQPASTHAADVQSVLDIEQVFDRAAIGMALVTLDGRPLKVNKAYAALLGVPEDQILAGNVADFVPARDREMELARHQGVVAGSPVSGVKKRYARPDGTVVYGLLASWLITDGQGMPAHVFTQVLDITDRHHATERMALMSERLEEAQTIAEVGSFAYDHETGQVEVSAQFRRIYRLPDLPAFSFDNLVALLPDAVRGPLAALISGGGPESPEGPDAPRKAHQTYTDADGVERTVISQARTERSDDGRPAHTTGTSQDATALLALQRQVERASSHDRLTGLVNRETVAGRARDLLAAAAQDGSDVSALFIDLDGFKTVNESLGYAAGDDLLRQVADRLQALTRPADGTRPEDMLGRAVSDEFVLVCADTGQDSAQAVAARITEALAAPIRAGDRHIFVRAGIGISTATGGQVPGTDDPSDPAEALLSAADEALGEAKRVGRGQVQTFTQSRRPAVVARMSLEQDLWTAIDEGQITAVFQPVVDLRTGQVVQAETFARWDHPVRGAISPAEFIAVADAAGLAMRIGEQVLRQAVAYLRTLAKAGHEHVAVSVNLSGQQVAHSTFPALVAAVLAEHGMPSERLIVEVTESAAVVAGGAGRAQLAALRAAGVRIALDDFGTGHSSLSSVRDLPLDYVKVDRSFSASVLTDPVSAEIVTAVARLTHQLDGVVISEGVETAEQLARITGLGIDLAQGYHLGRPMLAAELSAFLALRG